MSMFIVVYFSGCMLSTLVNWKLVHVATSQSDFVDVVYRVFGWPLWLVNLVLGVK